MSDHYTQALIYEGEQAWEHYRHIENQRNSFLAFLYTISLAAMGFVISLAASDRPDATGLALTAASPIGASLSLLGALIYISIERFRYILTFYRRALLSVRLTLFAGQGEETDEWVDEMDVYNHLPRHVAGKYFGAQNSAEISCLLLTGISTLTPIILFVYLASSGGSSAGALSVASGSALVAFIVISFLAVRHIASQRAAKRYRKYASTLWDPRRTHESSPRARPHPISVPTWLLAGAFSTRRRRKWSPRGMRVDKLGDQ